MVSGFINGALSVDLPITSQQNLGNGLSLIQTKTASTSANLSFTTGIATPYVNFMFVINQIVPSTGTPTFGMQVSTNGGSSYIGSGYTTGVNTNPYNSTTLTNTNSTSNLILSPAITGSPGVSGVIFCFNVTGATGVTFAGYGSTQLAALNLTQIVGSSTATAVNAFQFTMSSGNIASGSISLYGFLQ